MSTFSETELDYLREDPLRLGRLATVGQDGNPHVTPLGWSLDSTERFVEITGRNLDRSKKFRDIALSGRAALVVDDVLPPWSPRGVEIRGRAEALVGPPARIRLHPRRVVSWGRHEGATIDDTFRGRDIEDTLHA